ncbi:MAG: YceI family protein [Acidimicrobiales bacterium]
MARYLVVCDRTLESQRLVARMLELAAPEPCTFHVLVPASHPGGTWTWTEGSDQARAQTRLDSALGRLRARGLDVSGEVGDPSAVQAIRDVLLRRPDAFDEILLCTPPPGLTRRVGQDLPHRVRRLFPLPVSHLVAAPTRAYRGLEIPEAGVYQIDRAHSSVEFVARFLTISKVRGRFTEFSGGLHVAEVPEESSVAITIDAASLSTDNDSRDAHLRSPDFLDVDLYPTLTFHSTTVELVTEESWTVTGELTLHGVTRPVTLDAEFAGLVATASGEQRAGFSASTEIDREEWGVAWNQVLETGGVLVGKKVRVELDVQAVRSQ